jgi:hypothetical protein
MQTRKIKITVATLIGMANVIFVTSLPLKGTPNWFSMMEYNGNERRKEFKLNFNFGNNIQMVTFFHGNRPLEHKIKLQRHLYIYVSSFVYSFLQNHLIIELLIE